MKIYPEIPPVNIKPNPQLSNVVQNWGFFTKTQIKNAADNGSLLMLDLDFGTKCSLHCPTCFRRYHCAATTGEEPANLSYVEIIAVINEARQLGLEMVKICGAGEPTENPPLLKFAGDVRKKGIGMAIFTKGHVIGDDAWAARLFGPAVKSGEELAKALFESGASMLLCYRSFNPILQSHLVGMPLKWGYPARLKRAAEILAKVGFNKSLPTRLAFVNAPVMKNTSGEAKDIHHYCRERNILPVTAFCMTSGQQLTPAFLESKDATDTEKIELSRGIYEYDLAKGFHAREQLLREGISCMPGIHPCNQIAVGLYIMSNGFVMRCPGYTGKPLGSIRRESIAKIWKRCRDWEYKGKFNCGCPFKEGISLPTDYQRQVFNCLGLWEK